MTYALINTRFVMVEYFDNIFNFEFSAVYLRIINKLSKGEGNWVSASLTVEREIVADKLDLS